MVLVNGKPARASRRVKPGSKIVVQIPLPSTVSLQPEPIPIKIVYQDADLLVVDKPAGLTVHPAPSHTQHTLVHALLHCCPDLTDWGDSLRPGIVHRLDKDTSGLMVVAKNKTTYENLANQFQTRQVSKVYLVLVKGRVTPESGTIEAPIARHPVNRKKMAVVSSGRAARTQYRVRQYLDGFTLIEARPETGRTHQIRVHFSAAGYPVVGDSTYGVKSPYLNRQFLHASRLKFRLPSTGECREFSSELPPDLSRALDLTSATRPGAA